MELVYEFTFRAELGDAYPVGATPLGFRTVVDVTGGTARGERLDAVIVGPCGDWLTVGGDGFGRLDVRGQLRTHDGALIYFHYDGVIELAAAEAGREHSFEDGYFRTTPHLETADERYAWMNHTVFVGRGRSMPGAVEYEVFRVT